MEEKYLQQLRECCKDEAAFQQALSLIETNKRETAQSLRLYERLVAISPDAISLVNRDYVYEVVSDAYLNRSGRRREDIIGHSIVELMGEEIFQHVVKGPFDRCLAGETIHFQEWFPLVGGQQMFGDVLYAPYYDEEQDAITGVIVTSRDLTNMKLAEERLAENAQLLDLVDVAIISTDENFRITSWNKAAEEMYGWSMDEALGNRMSMLVPTEYQGGSLSDTRDRLVNTGHFEGEFIQTRRDGTKFPIHTVTSIIRDDHGKMSGAIAINRDITAEREAAQKLQESEAFFRTIYDGTQTGISVIDVTPDNDFRYVSMNPTYTRIPGWKSEMVQGKTPEELPNIPAELAANLRASFMNCLSTGMATTTEDHFFWGEHESWWLRHLTPIRNAEGRIYRIISFGLNITESKQAEDARRQLEKLELDLAKEREMRAFQSRVMSMITHDFKTPLAAIMTTTDLMRRYANKLTVEDFNERFDRIRAQVRILDEMVDEIVMLKRGEYNYTPHPELVDVDAFVRGIVADISLIARNDVKIQIVNADPCAQGYYDTALLRQIITNLVSNAMKYSNQSGEVRVHYICKRGRLNLVIEDDGVGIPDQDQQHIFELFFRAGNVIQTPGNGIGLAIVKQAVQSHGGKVSFESRPDAGTRFVVELPSFKDLPKRINSSAR